MPLQIGSGEITITAAGGTGSKTYAHGLPFVPDLILWFSNCQAAGFLAAGHYRPCLGATKDSTHEFCITGISQTGVGTSIAGSATYNNNSIVHGSTASTIDMAVDFTSVDATNFTMNVSDAPAADRVVQFLGIKGTALNIDVGTVVVATGTTEQTFAGITAATPKLLLFYHGGLAANTVNTQATPAVIAFGACSAVGTEWCVCEEERDPIATQAPKSVIQTSRSLQLLNAAGSLSGAFNVTSLDATGFKLTPSASFGGNTEIGFVAISGANFYATVGTDAQKTTTGDQPKTGVGFKPQLLLTYGTSATAVNTIGAAIRSSFGIAHGAANRSIGYHSTNGSDPMDIDAVTSSAKNLNFISITTDAVIADASLKAFDADGYTETWSTADATARLFGFVAMRENAVPVITSNGGGATAAINVAENTTAVTTVTATDADGDTVTFSISGGTDAAKFAIVEATGVLTFITAPDFENPTDVADGEGGGGSDNDYIVIVTASDGVLTDTQTITVTVTDVVDNVAPTITSNGGGATAAVNAAENQTTVTTVAATGTAPLTFSITGGADAAAFSIVAATGVLTFAAAPNFEHPADADGNNTYVVIATATNAFGTDAQTITVTVTNVNEAPVITSNGGGATAAVSVHVGTTAVTTVTATDVDAGATLTYSISGGADAASFSIVGATGVLTFAAAAVAGTYVVVVQASDGALTDTQTITVTVSARVPGLAQITGLVIDTGLILNDGLVIDTGLVLD